jgi:hypothetical protein
MLLLEGYISYFTCARYYLLYAEFSDFYVNQCLAGQTITMDKDSLSREVSSKVIFYATCISSLLEVEN